MADSVSEPEVSDYRRLTGNNSSRMIHKNAQERSQEGQCFPPQRRKPNGYKKNESSAAFTPEN